MSSTSQWERSMDKMPYPHMWAEFHQKESKDSEKVVRYWIQDLPEDRYDEAIQFMITHYVPNIPIYGSVDGIQYQQTMEIFQKIWLGLMKQKMTLVCLREGTDEIIGMNINFVRTEGSTYRDDIIAQSQLNVLKDFYEISQMMHKKANICKKYNVKNYMGSLGLVVSQKYRGLGLGQQLLEARKALAKPFGFKLTSTLFTSDFSNRIAEKAGFQSDIEYTCEELKRMFPRVQFGNFKAEKFAVKTLLF